MMGDLEVAWSGSLERAAIVAQQRPAPPIAEITPYGPMRKAGERAAEIMGVLRLAPSRRWTPAMVSAALPSRCSRSIAAGLVYLHKTGRVTAWREPWPCRSGYRLIYQVTTKGQAA